MRDALDRLIPDVAGDGVARADVIIEAIFENLEAKRTLFATLESAREARRDARDQHVEHPARGHRLARSRDPARLVGMHFFNPVARMMLVEVVVGPATRDPTLRRARAPPSCAQIDKLPLPVKSAPGFLVNRVLAPYLMTAMRCVDEGIAPEAVDEAAVAFGMPMGPIELADTVGLDICLAVGRMLGHGRRAAAKTCRAASPPGSSARRPGTGFYDVGRRQGRRSSRRGAVPGRTRRRGSSIRSSPRRRRRSPKASSTTPISSMPARSSARGSRRFAVARSICADGRRRAHERAILSGVSICRISEPERGLEAQALEPRLRRNAPRTGRLGDMTANGRRVVDRIWLKHYPRGVPAEIDVNEYASVREVFEESCRKFATRPAFSCMGRTITFGDLDALSATFGALAAKHRLHEGHARRADDAQHPPVSGVPVRRAARRLHGRQRQSAVHGARARASARGFRRRGDRRRRELRAYAAGGRRPDEDSRRSS